MAYVLFFFQAAADVHTVHQPVPTSLHYISPTLGDETRQVFQAHFESISPLNVWLPT